MKSKTITINGIEIVANSDGSITKPFYGKAKTTIGCNNGLGYRVVRIRGKLFTMHRIISKAFSAEYSEDLQVDHINGDRADNRPENLRMVTNQQNSQAHCNKRADTSSQYRGVTWGKREGKWKAQIMIDYKRKNLGCFDNERDAAIAYDAYASSQGFALEALNFPEHFIN